MKKLLIGIIVFFIFIILFLFIKPKDLLITISDKSNINYNRYKEENYYGYLKIPNINLNLGFYYYDNPLNDVSKNLEWIKIPVEDSYLFAAHSGVGQLAYFNDLHFLEIGDDIYLTINETEKHYKVINIYQTIKDGSINISTENNRIYLTTCDQMIKGYQLVIEGKLVE